MPDGFSLLYRDKYVGSTSAVTVTTRTRSKEAYRIQRNVSAAKGRAYQPQDVLFDTIHRSPACFGDPIRSLLACMLYAVCCVLCTITNEPHDLEMYVSRVSAR